MPRTRASWAPRLPASQSAPETQDHQVRGTVDDQPRQKLADAAITAGQTAEARGKRKRPEVASGRAGEVLGPPGTAREDRYAQGADQQIGEHRDRTQARSEDTTCNDHGERLERDRYRHERNLQTSAESDRCDGDDQDGEKTKSSDQP